MDLVRDDGCTQRISESDADATVGPSRRMLVRRVRHGDIQYQGMRRFIRLQFENHFVRPVEFPAPCSAVRSDTPNSQDDPSPRISFRHRGLLQSPRPSPHLKC